MAIRLTESRLRQIIQEERARLARRPLREGKFSYSSKASLLMDALDLLQEAQVHEQSSDIGDDPDLNSIVEALEGLIDAVQVLAADEDVVVDPFVPSRTPRSMRR